MTVGSAFRTAARTVTESDLVQFVNLCGFNEPLFYDERHAAEGGYTGRLVPGALVYALGEGLVIQTHSFAGTGLAFMHMELDVRRPTFVGDTIDVVVEILESRASSKPGRGVVKSRNTVYNERGDDAARLHAGAAGARTRLHCLTRPRSSRPTCAQPSIAVRSSVATGIRLNVRQPASKYGASCAATSSGVPWGEYAAKSRKGRW